MNNPKYERYDGESFNEYCHRISSYKTVDGLTWDDVADIINPVFGTNYCASKFRMQEYKYVREFGSCPIEEQCTDEITLDEMKKERFKLSDERIQINAMYRRMAREDTIKEIAKDFAQSMNDKLLLEPIQSTHIKDFVTYRDTEDREGILLISDWHYGREINSYWNVYNPDIAKQRINTLRDEVLYYVAKHNLQKLYVLNLGDLIAGRIHLSLRLTSRFDVITQIMEVSELLAEFLVSLNSEVPIEYYDTLDNHSRLEPNIKDAMDLESLARITTWYLKERLAQFSTINIHGNEFADDIITLNVMGHPVVGVHGHKDKPLQIIDRMTMMTQQHYDLVCAAHLHHFNCDEKNETVLVSNASLMGTDDFAEKLRLTSAPSQCLIISTKENVCENIYKINLN